MISLATSDLFMRNMTQVKREKSSTITRAYFFFPRDFTADGSQRSIYRSERGSVIFGSITVGCFCFVCLPCSQAEQRVSLSKLSAGIPRTRSIATNLLIALKFKCANLWCHNQLIFELALDNKQNEGPPVIDFRSKGNIDPFLFDLSSTSFVVSLVIILP
ncbi:hypothetical protein L2E82_35829 [Cichorium intybus]|uniref:Uncharacterized protein n=1 Tax=Cichorium intybus TaxID=13427 RepID=A0ACB9BQ13_CICIN|nr:hypothetical protein L2E82_35829 [Cichorium intybus]